MKKNTLFTMVIFLFISLFIFLGSCDNSSSGGETEYTLNVNYSGNGYIDPDSGRYTEGSVVLMRPYPESGWYFQLWEGTHADDIVNNQNGTYSITMDEDKTITAVFFEGTAHVLNLDITGDGSVEKDPPYYYHPENTDVLLTPLPDTGSLFASWGGSSVSDVIDNLNGTYSITMDENKSLTALFEEADYILTLNSQGYGTCSGSTSSTIGLTPPGYGYMAGTEVTITITLNDHTTFEGWSGADAGDIIDQGGNIYSIIMDDNKTILASFGLVMYSLTITVNGGVGVQETSNCGNLFVGTDSEDYVEDFTVVLSPDPIGTFTGWGGANSGDIINNGDNTYSLVMDSDKVIEANF